MSKEILLHSKKKTLSIHFKKDYIFSNHFISFCQSIAFRFVIITDHNVKKLYGNDLNNLFQKKKLNCELISISAKEKHKNRKTKENIENLMLQKQFNKDTLIIALGGGIVCDMSAFVASTYLRGIPLVIIPTNLLAMVDASIGGKTALNTIYGKNLIGSFYHPEAIFIDTNFLSSVPKKEIQNGFCEIIKYSLIHDRALFDILYKNKIKSFDDLIYKCCLIKKEYIEKDEKEQTIRVVLNFGHTIGHGLELLENYKISHGSAVAIGIITASFISYKLKFLAKEDFLKIFNIFKKYKFPLVFSSKVTWQNLLNVLFIDKKVKNQKLRFVLLEQIGKVKKINDNYLKELDKETLKKYLIWMCSRFKSKRD